MKSNTETNLIPANAKCVCNMDELELLKDANYVHSRTKTRIKLYTVSSLHTVVAYECRQNKCYIFNVICL